MDAGGVRVEGAVRIDQGGPDLVGHGESQAACLGGGLGFGDDRRDPLPDEAQDGVEHPGIGGIVPGVLMAPGREAAAGIVLVSQHGHDPRHRVGRGGVDRDDPGVRVGRAQDL